MKIILLGAPGAGKGTQAEKISKKFGIPTISTGFIIRNAIANETEVGKVAKGYIDKGQLVPDEVVTNILMERISNEDCKDGFILDGYPRTIAQGESLDDNNIKIDYVIDLVVPDEVILGRLTGRRECSKCGRTYHIVDNKPSVEGICDACGGELICRKDDNPETIKNRLEVYHSQTEPLEKFYTDKGLLCKVIGQDSVDGTYAEVLKVLEA
ncbi:MAG: adenylate kinase [Clostridia bacterium]|nr:adenylate kinase [Clostridia bacterium]